MNNVLYFLVALCTVLVVFVFTQNDVEQTTYAEVLSHQPQEQRNTKVELDIKSEHNGISMLANAQLRRKAVTTKSLDPVYDELSVDDYLNDVNKRSEASLESIGEYLDADETTAYYEQLSKEIVHIGKSISVDDYIWSKDSPIIEERVIKDR